MDWITGIQKAIDYVEEHLMESIDYENHSPAESLQKMVQKSLILR